MRKLGIGMDGMTGEEEGNVKVLLDAGVILTLRGEVVKLALVSSMRRSKYKSRLDG